MTKKKPKICITTYYTKDFEEIGKIAAESMKRYAKIHGYDVKVYTDHNLPKNLKHDRPAAWTKILIVQELMKNKKYDYIMWLDADAVFVRLDRDIAEVIEEQ